jgi:excinuclease ABC subunit A
MKQLSESSGPATTKNGDWIRIRGARVHNLHNINVDIPRNQLVVVTGVSGSGKSSLAFDTLYAEGKRQYIESLSAYARQFLDQIARPDVDFIDGLQPTLCIDQRPGNQNPRSTVATVTEIYDYLRLLVARLGEPTCYQCGADIRQQTIEQIQCRLLRMPEGTKTMILAPFVRGRKGAHKDVFDGIRKAGLVRARVDGLVCDLEDVPNLVPQKLHHIDAVVDRIIIRPGIDSRLADSVRLAVQYGNGLMVICYHDELDNNGNQSKENGTWRDEIFSTRYACPNCDVSYEELEPRTFSFNSPYGACPVCGGLGVCEEFDPELVVPDRALSLADGVISAWKVLTPATRREHQDAVEDHLAALEANARTPLSEISDGVFRELLYGDEKKFLGILMMLEKEFATTTRRTRLAQLEQFRGKVVCQSCDGARLRREATNVRIAGKAIHEITRLSVDEARQFFGELRFDESNAAVGEPLVAEIEHRLEFLQKVGIGYLTMDRSTDTLSGGEFQRVRLATSIGSGLVGVCYVLDEPSIGLHSRDNARLIAALRELQQRGNTVVVVEHDETVMRESDRLIDIGPGAGKDGGLVVSEGTPAAVIQSAESLTAQYLSGARSIPIPKKRRRIAKSRSLVLHGAAVHNLKDIDVRVPLNVFVCVTGVSGSGKSSLINETLGPALLRRLGQTAPKPGPHRGLRGVGHINKVVTIDQHFIGRTPRSNPATYTGVFDEIRKVFAGTRRSKQRGFTASRFSFNTKGGRCEACQGQGLQKIEMSFLPDLFVECDVCRGARFNEQTLQVHYRDRSIADVLAMSVGEAVEFFENFATIRRTLESLHRVGLGYLPLGQPSNTVSGGESQRIKLATELSRVDTGQTLYLLDEPTTGLHFDDIRRLLDVLQQLVDNGNTVLVIEHNLDVIKCADWVIDLGPDGGELGGYLIAEGTPENVAQADGSSTGQYLGKVLNV